MQNKNTFELIKTLDFNSDKKLSNLSQLFFLIIAGLGVGAIFLFRLYDNHESKTVFIVLSCIAYIIIHELTHIIFMKLFSKEKILFHFKFPYVAVGSASYFNKYQFIIIALAPIVLYTVVLSALFLVFPQSVNLLLSIVMILNFAGSSGDILQAYEISKLKKDIYIQDDGLSAKIYTKS